MEVLVRSALSSQSWTLSVDAGRTVGDLKQQLQDVMGASPEYMTISAGRMLGDDVLLASLPSAAAAKSPLVQHTSPYDSAKTVEVLLEFAGLEGGCTDEGFICCRCCGCATVIRPCECISRCCCFFSGCDLVDPNSLQCMCCRVYLCATDEQVERAVGTH